MRKRTGLFLLFFYAKTSLAAESAGLGKVANNLHLTFSGAAGIVRTFCLLVGAGLLTTAVIKYIERRNNPEDVSWGKIIALIIGAIAFIAIGLLEV